MLTKEQQAATRNLEAAQSEWLQAYGWNAVSRRHWRHPKIEGPELLARDAIAESRGRQMLSTSKQQRAASKRLEQVQAQWLVAYGWSEGTSGRWTHPQIKQFEFTMTEALEETRIKPSLGWPATRSA